MCSPSDFKCLKWNSFTIYLQSPPVRLALPVFPTLVNHISIYVATLARNTKVILDYCISLKLSKHCTLSKVLFSTIVCLPSPSLSLIFQTLVYISFPLKIFSLPSVPSSQHRCIYEWYTCLSLWLSFCIVIYSINVCFSY